LYKFILNIRKKGLISFTDLESEVPNKTGNVHINVTLRHVRLTIDAVKKGISITCSEFVSVATVIQQATRMHHIVICGLSGFTAFFTLSYKPQDFPKKVIEHEICVSISSTNLSGTFLILRRNERDLTKNVY